MEQRPFLLGSHGTNSVRSQAPVDYPWSDFFSDQFSRHNLSPHLPDMVAYPRLHLDGGREGALDYEC